MRLCIVEDEPLIAQRLKRFCAEILGLQLETIHVTERFDEAQAYLAEHAIDLLLLDLNLHGRTGFELLKTSVASSFHTIVVSANTDYALQAFEFGVLDFVPKPFTRERLAQALARMTGPNQRGELSTKYLAIKKTGRVQVIPVDEVLYAEGAGNYAELVLADGRRELHDKTLDKLQSVLPADFERIHKRYLVRLSAVKTLHVKEGSRYEAELKNGLCLPVGRTRYKEIRAKLA